MNNTLKIVGDVHSWITKGPHGKPSYTDITQGCDYSIQLGDMSFDYTILKGIDPDNHKFFPGNHDNFDTIDKSPHYTGARWGQWTLNNIPFFFCGCGFSLDWKSRLQHQYATGEKIWWEEEQLSYTESHQCWEAYKALKPKLVITHEAPRSIANILSDPSVLRNFGYDPDTFTTSTSELLQSMFEDHQPEMWIFGHYHKSWNQEVNRTWFRCLDELEHIDLELTSKGNIIVV